MPVYNAARYLAAAIVSILQQTYEKFEFLIVDDGSTDRSLAIIRKYAADDQRIKVFSRGNTGIVGALNEGLNRAAGTFIARMDADDLAVPTRLESQLSVMQDQSECVALGAAVLFVDPEGHEMKVYAPCRSHDEIRAEIADGNGGAMVHPTLLLRRKALVLCGGYREKYNFIEDLDLYVRLLEFGTLQNLPEVLLRYRQHPQSVNHIMANRAAQIEELVAPLREKMGLPLLRLRSVGDQASPRASTATYRRKWALQAAEGGNYQTARFNALRAVLCRPWERSHWACLRYVLGLRDRVPVHHELS